MFGDLGSGPPGVGLSSGDHICAFHFGPAERDLLLRLYLHAGMVAGDKCVCIVDEADPGRVFQDVQDVVGRDPNLVRDQLTLTDADHSYLRAGGFTTQRMIEFLDAALSDALRDGHYPHARVVGEMSWILRHPALVPELFAYESEVNRFSPRYPQVLMCLYDLERIGTSLLVDILRTHPKLLLGGLLIDNPNYLTPDECAALREPPG